MTPEPISLCDVLTPRTNSATERFSTCDDRMMTAMLR